jgi:hypothetical protein
MTTESTGAANIGRHPVNISHLVMGLAFAGLVVIWALIVGDVIDTDHVGPLLGLPWVFAGAIGLLAAFLAGRQRRSVEPPAYPAPYTDPTTYTTTDDTEELR